MKRDDSLLPPSSERGPPSSRVPSSSPSSSGRTAKVDSEAVARPRGLARELGLWSAIGVLAATLMTVCTNVLAARFYKRWDVTSAGLYTLSQPTRETLSGLADNVEIVVFLARTDPDFGGLTRLLDQYRAASRLISVRQVDPDRDPAEFIALSSRYRLNEGRAEGGRLVSDAALVVARGEARWVIGAEDISEFDEEHGVVEPRAEQAITEGLRQVLDPTPVNVCFSSGQGEPALDDTGPTGLGALDYTLRKNNYDTRQLDLGAASGELAIASCDLIVVAAPGDRLSPAVAQKLALAARRGKAVLASIGPSLDEDQRPAQSGLEPLYELFGLRSRAGLIFERDPDAVLPVGLGGEAFLATPRSHAITVGLLHGAEPRYRVLLQLAQGLEPSPARAADAANAQPEPPAKLSPLLVTSERAFGVLNAARLAEGGLDLDALEHDSEGPYTVAYAGELGVSSKDKRAGRIVVIGSASPLLGSTWQDPTLTGTRRFVESAVSWLVARPTLVSVPEKPGREVELRFTEESLSEVVRYVLVYMPGTALALGGLILLRRRSGSAARGPSTRAKPKAASKEPGKEGVDS
jgi:gliding motility-associatede transport system auxiliary component